MSKIQINPLKELPLALKSMDLDDLNKIINAENLNIGVGVLEDNSVSDFSRSYARKNMEYVKKQARSILESRQTKLSGSELKSKSTAIMSGATEGATELATAKATKKLEEEEKEEKEKAKKKEETQTKLLKAILEKKEEKAETKKEETKKEEAEKVETKEVPKVPSLATIEGKTASTTAVVEKIEKVATKKSLGPLTLVLLAIIVILFSLIISYFSSLLGTVLIIKMNPHVVGIPKMFMGLYGASLGWYYMFYCWFRYGFRETYEIFIT